MQEIEALALASLEGELGQPLPEKSPGDGAEGEKEPGPHYFAWLGLWGTLGEKTLLPKGSRKEGVSPQGERPKRVYVLQDPILGEVPLRFPQEVWERLFWALRRNLGRTVLVSFAPRTDAQGLWSPRHSLAMRFYRKEAVEPSRFQARGRLVEVHPEEGQVVLEVRPNPQGLIKEPFRLTLHASLALLEGLPPVGSGVYLEGELRLKTRRLVVRRAEPARLWDD